MTVKRKNGWSLALLLAVLGVSYGAEHSRLMTGEPPGIPVVRVEEEALITSAGTLSELENYRLQRNERRDKDMAALETMIASEHTAEKAREDARQALLRLVEEHEKETAMEGAMTAAGFSPCLCVAEGGGVTLMVGRQTLTAGETNLLITLAQNHTGAAPERVMVLTGSMI